MVSHWGFEPQTLWLKVKCSADWANGSLWVACTTLSYYTKITSKCQAGKKYSSFYTYSAWYSFIYCAQLPQNNSYGQGTQHKTCKIGGKWGRQGLACFFHLCYSVVDCNCIECCFGWADYDACYTSCETVWRNICSFFFRLPLTISTILLQTNIMAIQIKQRGNT